MIMENTPSDAHILVSLTYASRAKYAVSSADFLKILQQAKKNNSANGITGMMTCNKEYFLQTIEGPRAQINRLFQSLLSDKRHFDLQVIESREIKVREWAEWSMNYASPTSSNRAIYLKYSTTVSFNPYYLNSEATRALLHELSTKRAIAKALKQQGKYPTIATG